MANPLPQHMIVVSPIGANQENVPRSVNPLATIRSTVQDVRVAYIDRPTKESGKHSCSLWSSNTGKVESLLCFVDDKEVVFALVDNSKVLLPLLRW